MSWANIFSRLRRNLKPNRWRSVRNPSSMELFMSLRLREMTHCLENTTHTCGASWPNTQLGSVTWVIRLSSWPNPEHTRRSKRGRFIAKFVGTSGRSGEDNGPQIIPQLCVCLQNWPWCGLYSPGSIVYRSRLLTKKFVAPFAKYGAFNTVTQVTLLGYRIFKLFNLPIVP